MIRATSDNEEGSMIANSIFESDLNLLFRPWIRLISASKTRRREFALATATLELALERLKRIPPGPGRTKDFRKVEKLLAEAGAGLPR